MNQYTFDDIKDMIGEYADHGHYVSCLCCFHSDQSPSMLIFSDGWFRCLACGKTGSWYTLARALKGWSAGKVLKEKVSWQPPTNYKEDAQGICISAHKMLNDNIDSLGWYLEMRGVLGRVMPCRLGWRAGWYTIPVYDKDGMFEGYVLRASTHIQMATGRRFTMPKGQPAMMYVPDWNLYESSDRVFVVFGIFDSLALSEIRQPVVTTTAGMLSFDPAWLNDYRKRIYVLPDKGEEKAANDLVAKLGWRGKVIKLDYPAGCKDPADLLNIKHNKKDVLLSQLMAI